MESLMILWSGLLSFWSISVVLQPKKKRTGLTKDAVIFTLTWQAHRGKAITWDVARSCRQCWDIAETKLCSRPVELWTFLFYSIRCRKTIQRNITCLEQILLPCYCVILSKDSLSRSPCNGGGSHIAQLQHIHSTFVLVLFKDIATKLLILLLHIIKWHMMRLWVWAGFFMSLIQRT